MMNISNILFTNNNEHIEDFLPVKAVETTNDIARYREAGYNVVLTAAEFCKNTVVCL